MKRVCGGALFLLAQAACCLALAQGSAANNPVQKVVKLLTELRAQVEKQGKDEAASYDKFACFCKEQADNKLYVIGRSEKKITELQAAIDALTPEITQLDADVVARKDDIVTEETQAATAVSERNDTHTAYLSKSRSLREAVDAVGRALTSLQASRDTVRDAKAALLQPEVRRAVAALPQYGVKLPASVSLLATGSGLEAPGDAPSYEYHSKEVIDTLKQLQKTFKSQLATTDEEEATSRHSFEMTEGARANRIKALQKEIDEKTELSASKSAEKSDKEKLKTEEENDKNADQSFLDELTATCEKKATLWEQRSTQRASEITAITEAKAALKGAGEKYGANAKLVGLQVRERQPRMLNRFPRKPVPVSFVQMGRRHKRRAALRRHHRRGPANGRLAKVMDFVEARAGLLQSGSLAALAERLSLVEGPDHFVRVRSIIKDLIARLETEASEEATQKSFCDTEMKKAIDKRDAQNGDMEKAGASIDETTSELKVLEADLVELDKQIADLEKAKKEMTDLRAEEKARNEKTISDAEAGALAVKEAITILDEFYGAAAEAALLQRGARYTPPNADRSGKSVSDVAPEAGFDSEYHGNVDASKGIVGLLEVVQSDFERTASTTTTAEADLEKDFQAQLSLTEGEITAKKGLKTQKEGEQTTKSADLTGFEDDLKEASRLHDEALSQLDKLKVSCVDAAESYAERTKKREDEIAALKQALQILEDWQN